MLTGKVRGKARKSIQLARDHMCEEQQRADSKDFSLHSIRNVLSYARGRKRGGARQKWTDSYLLSDKSNWPHKEWWESSSKLMLQLWILLWQGIGSKQSAGSKKFQATCKLLWTLCCCQPEPSQIMIHSQNAHKNDRIMWAQQLMLCNFYLASGS